MAKTTWASGSRSVQHKQLIFVVHGSGMDWLAFSVFHKPIRVMLINPGALRYLKGRSPDTGN